MTVKLAARLRIRTQNKFIARGAIFQQHSYPVKLFTYMYFLLFICRQAAQTFLYEAQKKNEEYMKQKMKTLEKKADILSTLL